MSINIWGTMIHYAPWHLLQKNTNMTLSFYQQLMHKFYVFYHYNNAAVPTGLHQLPQRACTIKSYHYHDLSTQNDWRGVQGCILEGSITTQESCGGGWPSDFFLWPQYSYMSRMEETLTKTKFWLRNTWQSKRLKRLRKIRNIKNIRWLWWWC